MIEVGCHIKAIVFSASLNMWTDFQGAINGMTLFLLKLQELMEIPG
jgi:hypothetical protein